MAMPSIAWTEVLCILHGRKHSFARKNEDYEVLHDLSLEKLVGMPESHLKSVIPHGHSLRDELLKIRKDYSQKKAIWLADTKAPKHSPVLKYTHWLPLDPSRLLDEPNQEIKDNWQEVLNRHYKEFDTLVHATHIDTTVKIFQDQLRTRKVQDNSMFSQIPGHPNEATEVLWFGPVMKKKLFEPSFESRYGNVAFYMNTLWGSEGIRRSDWKYYFVEVIDYASRSACRILVTTNTYPHLRPYDPTEKGGPWYYDKTSGKDYCLKDIIRWDGERGNNGNDLEIMREDYGAYQHTFLKNLLVCPVLHGPNCIKTKSCKFLGDREDEYHILSAVYGNETKKKCMEIDSVSPIVKTTHSPKHSKTYKMYLVNTKMIENAKVKITFWENMKINIEEITQEPFNLGDLTSACEQNKEVKESMFELMLGIAAENIEKNQPYFRFEKEFPYSLSDVLDCKLLDSSDSKINWPRNVTLHA